MDVNEIDNDELYYQINMFQNACGFDIKKGGYGNVVSIDNTDIKFCNKKYQSDKLNYNFEIMKGKVGKKDSFTIKGSYNDLLFAFHNFYKKDKNEDISQIAFSFFLEKDFEDARYTVDVETINNFKTKFNFNRKPKNDDELTDYFTFYSKRSDFENIFGIIKSFIDNPKNVYFSLFLPILHLILLFVFFLLFGLFQSLISSFVQVFHNTIFLLHFSL